MKHFLVAFDFSKNALHTLEYAIIFANKMEADLSLVWVDNTSTPDHLYNIDQDLRIETKTHFDEVIEKYEPLVHHGKINPFLRKGKVNTEVSSVARTINANLIFAGTHGTSGYEEFWIGSNAYRIVASAPCPVISLRLGYAIDSQLKKILLPIDNSADTKHKLPYAAKIAKAFDAEIHILLMQSSPISVIRNRMKNYGIETSKFLENEGVRYVFSELKVENVTSSILHYTEANQIDQIAMMTEQGGPTSSMLLGPYAQQLINNAPVPVLSVQSVNNV